MDIKNILISKLSDKATHCFLLLQLLLLLNVFVICLSLFCLLILLII